MKPPVAPPSGGRPLAPAAPGRLRAKAARPSARGPDAAVPTDAAGTVTAFPVLLGVTLRAAADRELARAAAMLALGGTRLHFGVHQGRKSLRRTRAAMALAASALGRSGRLVDRELRRLLDSLSDLRDGQALVEALRRASAALPPADAPLFARAVRVAERRRALLAQQAGRVALDREGLDMIATLRASLAGMPWERVDRAGVARMLRESEARIAAAADAVRADRSDEEAWHDWRRRARRLAQQQRHLAGTTLDADRGALHGVAERLGAAQDLALLLAHCGRDSPFAREDRRALAHAARALQAQARDALLAPPSGAEPAGRLRR